MYEHWRMKCEYGYAKILAWVLSTSMNWPLSQALRCRMASRIINSFATRALADRKIRNRRHLVQIGNGCHTLCWQALLDTYWLLSCSFLNLLTLILSSLCKRNIPTQVLILERGPPTEFLPDTYNAFRSKAFKDFVDEWINLIRSCVPMLRLEIESWNVGITVSNNWCKK